MKPLNTRQILCTFALAGILAGPSAPFAAATTGDVAQAAEFSSFRGLGMRRMTAPRESFRRMRGGGRRFRGEGRRGARFRRHRRFRGGRGSGFVFSGPGFGPGPFFGAGAGRRGAMSDRDLKRLQLAMLAFKTSYNAARALKKLIGERNTAAKARRKDGYRRDIHRRFGIGAIDRALVKIAGRALRDYKRMKKNTARKMRRSFRKRVREIDVVLRAIDRTRKALKARTRKLKAHKTRNEKYLQRLKDQEARLKKLFKSLYKIRAGYRAALKEGIR